MGRTLDALRRPEWPTTEPPTTAPAAPAAPESTDDDSLGEAMPFIEVGAPTKRGAPAAVWVANTPRPAEPAAKKATLQTPTPRPVTLTPRAPLTVTLQGAAPAEPARPLVAPEVIAFHQPDHAVSQHYRALLSRLLAEQPAAGGRV